MAEPNIVLGDSPTAIIAAAKITSDVPIAQMENGELFLAMAAEGHGLIQAAAMPNEQNGNMETSFWETQTQTQIQTQIQTQTQTQTQTHTRVHTPPQHTPQLPNKRRSQGRMSSHKKAKKGKYEAALESLLANLLQKMTCPIRLHGQPSHVYVNPRALACGHSGCVSCLEQLLVNGQIICTVCQHVTGVPSYRVLSLARDSAIDALLKDDSLMSSLRFLAERANDNTHHSSDDDGDEILCNFHSCELDIFCEDCDGAICSRCLAQDHRQHCVFLREDVDTLLDTVEQCKKNGEDLSRTAAVRIGQNFQSLRELLRQRENELLGLVEKENVELRAALDVCRGQLEESNQDLRKLRVSTIRSVREYSRRGSLIQVSCLDPSELAGALHNYGAVNTASFMGRIVAAQNGGSVRVWDMCTNEMTQSLSPPTHWLKGRHRQGQIGMECLSLVDAERGVVAGGCGNCNVYLWNVYTGHLLHTLIGHVGEVDCLGRVSGHADWLVSGSVDKTLKVWDTTANKCVLTYKGHTDSVFDVAAASLSESLLASASEDGTVHIWSAENGENKFVLRKHSAEVMALCLAYPKGGLLASGSRDSTVRIWDVERGLEVHCLDAHVDEVWALCTVDQSLGTMASGSNDKTVRVWNAVKGKCVATLIGHTNEVWVVLTVNQSLGLLASGSRDKTLRIWDIVSGECVHVLTGHTDSIWTACVVDSDNCIVATGSYDWTVRVWDALQGRCTQVLSGDSSISSIVFVPPSRADSVLKESGGGQACETV